MGYRSRPRPGFFLWTQAPGRDGRKGACPGRVIDSRSPGYSGGMAHNQSGSRKVPRDPQVYRSPAGFADDCIA